METSSDNPPTLDYSNPRHTQRRSAGVIWIIAVVLVFEAMIRGDVVLDEFRHREKTQAYIQYTVTQDWRAKGNPSYVPPPFTGRKFVYESPLELKSFYACILFAALGGLTIRAAFRRQSSRFVP